MFHLIPSFSHYLYFFGVNFNLAIFLPIFGDGTNGAVHDFQRSQGITVDRVVGPQTLGRVFR
ncbi:peptidoglycan-binding protein [Bacillus sp. JCM 19034]|uniref:peptidoglycan-binding domain-containing protein n=1 Tax=Bacillus sp. JCM 19034 TaxID=1481928 RepID=UPI0009EBF774|nr:peptidoglycan-binding domain-containing protein [Bacillus sp. JCM 19034]